MSRGANLNEAAVCEGDWSIFSITPEIPASHLAQALASPTAVRYAYDGGVLELLGLSIAVLGAGIALLALFGFWFYSYVVDRAARKETKEIAPDIIEKMLRADPELWLRVLRNNPSTFHSAIREAMDSMKELEEEMAGTSADDIAAHAAGENDDRSS